jgi:SAM-dependent methyltransferase
MSARDRCRSRISAKGKKLVQSTSKSRNDSETNLAGERIAATKVSHTRRSKLRSAVTTYANLVGIDPVLIPLDLPELHAMRSILRRTFLRPQGALGAVGGMIMARTNSDCGVWVTDLLEITSSDNVLEVGFGPGVIIQYLSELVRTGHITGIDQSREMVKQARARNATAIQRGCVDLLHGSVDRLPFCDNSFDKALAINSMQVWPDATAGLREIRRVLKPASSIALGFTSYSGQRKKGLRETVVAAGFTRASVVEVDKWFCVLAMTPRGA